MLRTYYVVMVNEKRYSSHSMNNVPARVGKLGDFWGNMEGSVGSSNASEVAETITITEKS